MYSSLKSCGAKIVMTRKRVLSVEGGEKSGYCYYSTSPNVTILSSMPKVAREGEGESNNFYVCAAWYPPSQSLRCLWEKEC